MESKNQGHYVLDELPRQAVFALDIGTRSIIGMVGIPNGERMQIAAIEKVEHSERAMIDGQIENIDQVSRTAGVVKEKLEKRLGCKLARVAVAAAGRSLRTESVTYEMELEEVSRITAETVSRLEAGAISRAEQAFFGREEGGEQRFYLVGYSVSRYYLDDYILSSLIDHSGRVLKADVIATFLPSEVVESLYSAMHKIGLEIASLTLEPIAAINAAIPENIRLLNLALVDIGAGTSDIAVCRDGCITGYTMAVQAGDELTESIVKKYLVDFQTAEMIKAVIGEMDPIVFCDIMGLEQKVSSAELCDSVKEAFSGLCEEICSKILEANGGAPSAVFLAGGGSLFPGLREGIAERLGMDISRVAIAGRNFGTNAYSDEYNLENPEYATPLGIVISAGLNMINDSFRILLNGEPAKLFRSGTFTVMNVLMMNGYSYQDMMGKSGQNLVVQLNGKRKVFYGEKAEPCVLKLNGEDGQLSDLVRAGDRIEFIPVRHGADASAMVSQLVEGWANHHITVNGVPVTEDIPLKAGDIVLAEGVSEEADRAEGESGAKQKTPKKRGPKPKAAGTPATEKKKKASAQSGGRRKSTAAALAERKKNHVIPEEEGKQAGEAVAVTKRQQAAEALEREDTTYVSAAEVMPAVSEPEVLSVASEPAGRNIQGQIPIPAKEAEVAVDIPEVAGRPFTEAPQAIKRQETLMLYLNGQPLILPSKPDGSPYFLMDMLEYSDLDIEKVTSPVILEVNGENGTFQQELKSGDAVRIFEQKR